MDSTDCDNCGAQMRWETSHSRCDRCGYIRPCCEGAPVSAGCVVPPLSGSMEKSRQVGPTTPLLAE